MTISEIEHRGKIVPMNWRKWRMLAAIKRARDARFIGPCPGYPIGWVGSGYRERRPTSGHDTPKDERR